MIPLTVPCLLSPTEAVSGAGLVVSQSDDVRLVRADGAAGLAADAAAGRPVGSPSQGPVLHRRARLQPPLAHPAAAEEEVRLSVFNRHWHTQLQRRRR